MSSPHDPENLDQTGDNSNPDWLQILSPSHLDRDRILYSLLLLVFTIWIIIGNSLVCLGTIAAYKVGEVCPIYLCYVSGLDVIVGIFLLPFMSIIKLVGHFPFGHAACDVFVFWDYYVIVASNYGYFTVIMMFFLEVKCPNKLIRNTQFHVKILLTIWFSVILVWVPAYFADLYTEDPQGAKAGTMLSPNRVCGYSNHNNTYGALYLALFGFLIPYLVGIWLAVAAFALLCKQIQQQRKEVTKNLKQTWRRNRIGIWRKVSGLKTMSKSKLGKVRKQFNGKFKVKSFCIDTRIPNRHLKNLEHEAKLVYAIFLMFCVLRAPFYFYFSWGIFNSSGFPQDVSIGIYWVMDINSVISCILHLTFEPIVRRGVRIFFTTSCRKKNQSPVVSIDTEAPRIYLINNGGP